MNISRLFVETAQGETLFRPVRLFARGSAYRLSDPTQKADIALSYISMQSKVILPFFLMILLALALLEPGLISLAFMAIPLLAVQWVIQGWVIKRVAAEHGLVPYSPTGS